MGPASVNFPEFIAVVIAIAKSPEPVAFKIGVQTFSAEHSSTETIVMVNRSHQMTFWKMRQRLSPALSDAYDSPWR